MPQTQEGFLRRHSSKIAAGVAALVIAGVSDTIKAEVSALTDRVFHRTLHRQDLVWVPADCPGGGGTPKRASEFLCNLIRIGEARWG